MLDNNNSMKKKINEATYIGRDSINSLKKDPKYNTLSSDVKKTAEDELQKGDIVKLGEMARLSIGYKLADSVNTDEYANKMMSGVSLKSILDFIQETPGSTMKQIQEKFGFKRPQMVQALFTKLLNDKIITPYTHGGVEIPTKTNDDGEEEPIGSKKTLSTWSDKEDMFVGPYFDDEEFVRYGSPDSDESEPESKPEIPSPSTKTLSSASEKAADFFFDDSNERLLKKLIDAWAAAKLRIREASEEGGLSSSDFRSAEKSRKVKAVGNLPELITQYVDRIKSVEDQETINEIVRMLAKKLSSVGYVGLTKRIAKELGVEIPKTDPIPDGENISEETIEPINESLVYRMKILANIK